MKKLEFRRRREEKTDYKRRMQLLISGKPRLVVRITNRKVVAQIMGYEQKGDKVIVSADSKDLVKFGLQQKKNTMATYLVGLLCGVRARSKGVNDAVLDIGLRTPTKGARVFAAVKGAADAGLNVPHNPEIIPKEERIIGKNAEEFKKAKDKILSSAKAETKPEKKK